MQHEVIRILPEQVKQIMLHLPIDMSHLQEIHMRVNQPFSMVYENEEWYVTTDVRLSKQVGMYVPLEWIQECMQRVSNYSIYAHEEELRQGFITIKGGHRVGVAGKTVVEGNGIVKMKHISFLNIRLAHQVLGCAKQLLPCLQKEGKFCNTLLISPPRCGKTTMLRDLIRLISTGNSVMPGKTVGVVDERSEIAACFQGVPQNDVGPRTDVLDACPKAQGMTLLIRSMSPEVIAVDEIGGEQDAKALAYVTNCGCQLLATAHGATIEDMKQHPVICQLVHRQMFERYVLLGKERKGKRELTVLNESLQRMETRWQS